MYTLQVKQGKLKRSEIKDCVKMLLPTKSDIEVEQLINDLHSAEEPVSESEEEL